MGQLRSWIIKTDDEGYSWNTIGDSVPFVLTDLLFLNEDDGFAVGYKGIHGSGETQSDTIRFLKTYNGGESWTVSPIPFTVQSDSLRGLEFVSPPRLSAFDSNHIWIVDGIKETFPNSETYQVILAKTFDGGNQWEFDTVEEGDSLFYPPKIEFFSEISGILIIDKAKPHGIAGKLLRTEDGGSTWDTLISDSFSQFVDFSYLSQQKGWVLGKGKIYKTTDGENFEEYDLPQNFEDPKDIEFLNDFIGYVLGMTSDIYKSEDGGETWTPIFLILPRDSCDSSPDLFLGRAPCEDEEETHTFLKKIMDIYEAAVDSTYLKSALLMGGSYWNSTDGDFAQVKENLQVQMDSLGNIWWPNDWDTLVELYAPVLGVNPQNPLDTIWAGDAELTDITAMNALSYGFHFVNHYDHSNCYAIGTGSNTHHKSVGIGNVPSITNGNRLSIVFSLGCQTNAIHYHSIAEAFMNKPTGGAVAWIGGTWDLWPQGYIIIDDRDNSFFKTLFSDSLLYIGECFNAAQVASAGIKNLVRLNLLGDPAMIIWRDKPQTLQVTHPDTIFVGSQSIGIGVSPQIPKGAIITLYKPGEVFDTTRDENNSGNIETYLPYFNPEPIQYIYFDISPETPGPLYLTIRSFETFPVFDTIWVTQSGPPTLSIADYEIDDDSLGESIGNGDHEINPGERIELPISLRNTGSQTATGVRAILSLLSNQGAVNWITDTVNYGDINPGDTVLPSSPFLFDISTETPETLFVIFRLTIEGDTGQVLSLSGSNSKNLKITLLKDANKKTKKVEGKVNPPLFPLEGDPQLQWEDNFTLWIYPDSLNYAGQSVNGLQLQPEDFIGEGHNYLPFTTLHFNSIRVENLGSGRADSVYAILSYSGSQVIQIIDSVSFIGSIPPHSSVTTNDGFVVKVYGQNIPKFIVKVRDRFGREWAKEIDVYPPQSPDTLFELARGPQRLKVAWEFISGAPIPWDLYGYNLYRADTGGNFERLNDLLLRYSYYPDSGLLPLTEYRYYVTAVDSSGNESDPSDTFSFYTEPRYLSGWPLNLHDYIFGSPKVCDIDNDGTNEIVVTSEYRGLFVLSRDDSIIFHDSIPGIIYGGPAVGDMDNDGYYEIAVANMFSLSLYSFDGDSLNLEWRKEEADSFYNSPVFEDFDGDGNLELAAVNVRGKIYIYEKDGSGTLFYSPPDSLNENYFYGSPAVADINRDGYLDLIVGSRNLHEIRAWSVVNDSLIFTFHVDGVPFLMSPAVGNIDTSDSSLEIATVCGNTLYILKSDGSVFWQQSGILTLDYSSPHFAKIVLSDLDGDGVLEVIAGDKVFKSDGSLYLELPITPVGITTADLDGDGAKEILASDQEGKLYAFNIDGSIIPGFPIERSEGIKASATICDLDQDGKLDIALGFMNYMFYVWTLGESYNPLPLDWPTFRHDLWNTGAVYERTESLRGGVLSKVKKRGLKFALYPIIPNPVGRKVMIRFSVAKKGEVKIKAYDVSGRLVREILRGIKNPGIYDVRWDMRDMRERRLPQGIYFIRMETERYKKTRKLLLLR